MKRIVLIIALLGLFGTAGATAFGIAKANTSKSVFTENGSVLLGNDSNGGKKVEVSVGTAYTPTVAGTVNFKTAEGGSESVPLESFIVYDDDSVASFTSGIILDFDDMTGNFINNYCIPAEMKISRSGSEYYAATTNGDIRFGEHIWKLTDNKYLICSPSLEVHFAEDDVRTANDYVQVCVSEDGVVRLLTPENLWTTLTSDCYVMTAGGVKVVPVTQRIENTDYKLSLASLSVGADDNIVLTEDETRRQIVPQIKINTIDGTDGEAGEAGIVGEGGEDGTKGTDGKSGTNGTDGENGNSGSEGTSGTSGSSGASGSSGTNGQNGAEGAQGEGSQSEASIAVKYNGAQGDDGGSLGNGSDGDPGTGGDSGDPGALGDKGNDGDPGTGGDDGDPGIGGKNGDPGTDGGPGTTGDAGGTGKNGRDADETTSLKSQIPVITITGWEVYTTALRGAITIQDPSGFFPNVEGETTHPAYITITDRVTGETIQCVSYGEDSKYQKTSITGTNFWKNINQANGSNGKTFYFGMDPDSNERLSPDSSYILTVTAYYGVNGTIYRREFVSRVFFTDSTGISLSLDDLTITEYTKEDTSTDYYAGAAVNVLRTETGDAAVKTAKVYLLTQEQNRTFSLNSKNDYTYLYTITYSGENPGYIGTKGTKGKNADFVKPASMDSLTLQYVPTQGIKTSTDFGGLDTDTDYIARVIITSDFAGVSKESLCPQELELTTLKRCPEWTKTNVPTVVYNRLTGGFEVSRPAVFDMDDSIVRYTYTPYVKKGATGTWERLDSSARTITPGVADPVSFSLPTSYEDGEGKTQYYYYKFTVDIESFDNEKTVYYNMGDSEQIQAKGSMLPTFNFTTTTSLFNYVEGVLYITMDKGSSLLVNETNTLTLSIYGDTYYDNTIVLKKLPEGSETVCGARSSKDGHCAPCKCASCSRGCTTAGCDCDWWVKGSDSNASSDGSTSSVQLNLAIDELYMNQKYTITVFGSLFTGVDETGANMYERRELGSFTFRTPGVSTVTASWADMATGADPLNVVLRLQAGKDVDTNELKQGEVTLQLYEGKGDTKTQIVAKSITGANVLAMYTEGLLIQQSLFDRTLTQGKEYTLEVVDVCDKTYFGKSESLYEYSNKITAVSTKTKTIQAKKTPPDLTSTPHLAIDTTPILNKNAAAYGETVDPDLDDNAVIGYVLQANYDNISELGYKVKYYAFEFTDFWAAVEQGIDPVGNYLDKDGTDISATVGIPKLATWTRTFETTDSKPTKIAVIFGKETTPDSGAINKGSYYKYYIAPMKYVAPTGEIKGHYEGMERGYRYIFAYTVEYYDGETTASSCVYPYGDQTAYQNAIDNYGIGQMILNNKGTIRGKGLAYVMNSGIQEAPKGKPEFHTYLSHVEKVDVKKINSGLSDLSNYATEGVGIMKYYYIDKDRSIERDSSGNMMTDNIHYQYYHIESNSLALTDGYLTLSDKEKTWNSMELSYGRQIGSVGDVCPEVNFQQYLINYNESILGEGEGKWGLVDDPLTLSMGTLLPDFAWKKLVDIINETEGTKNSIPAASIEVDNDHNMLYFYFDTSDAIHKEIMKHAYMAKLHAVAPNKVEQDFMLTVKGDTSSAKSCYLEMATSRLGEEKASAGEFTFSIELYFDNGDQGWGILDPSNTAAYGTDGFGLYSYERLATGKLNGGKYFVSYTTAETLPYGGLFDPSASAVDFSPNVAETPKRIATGYHYQNTSLENVFSKYLYAAEKGVDYSASDDTVGSVDTNILIPKGVAVNDVYFNGKTTVKDTIKIILPVVHWQGYDALPGDVVLNVETEENKKKTPFKVTGLETAISYKRSDDEVLKEAEYEDLGDTYYILYAQIFEYDKSAESRTDGNIPDGKYPRSILIKSDGTVYGTFVVDGTTAKKVVTKVNYNEQAQAWENLPQIGDGLLADQTKYWLSMYMELNDGNRHVLMKSDSNEKASYEVNTSREIELAFTGLEYDNNNISYFTKSLRFGFNISPRAYGMKMKYEIYDTEAKATEGDEAKAYINLNTEPGTLHLDTSYLRTTGNSVTLYLDPATLLFDLETEYKARINNLVPGKKYWLRISAWNKQGVQQGSAQLYPFTVPYTKITGGITLGQVRSADSVSFKVQVRDIRHLSMGYHYKAGDPTSGSIDPDQGSTTRKYNDEGLYAVRFTDANGKRFYTIYDDYVFSYADIANEFILSRGTQKTGQERDIEPETAYTCNIYNVKDLDLDGLSGKSDNADDQVQKDWKYFFGDMTIKTYTVGGVEYTGFKSAGFNTLLDTLWTDKGEYKPGTQIDIENNGYYTKLADQFLLESKSKTTTKIEGMISMNEDNMELSPKTSTIVFQVTEASGVVTLDADGNQVQGFDKIHYTVVREDNGQIFEETVLKTEAPEKMFYGTVKSGKLTGTFTYTIDLGSDNPIADGVKYDVSIVFTKYAKSETITEQVFEYSNSFTKGQN